MKVTKIIDKCPTITEDGEWLLWVQVYMGNSYVYGAIACKTKEEAFSIKEDQILDMERVKFGRRTNVNLKK